MENRKWEEELAGRWQEILALVACGPGTQAGEDGNQLSVLGKKKSSGQRAGKQRPGTDH